MISSLRLLQFRCYDKFAWNIPQAGALITGDNAAGKTTLLESIHFLLRLQSPRSAKIDTLLRHNCAMFGVRGNINGQTRRITWSQGNADLQVDGQTRKDQRNYLADSYPVVWMGNDDLSLVQAGADIRRKYLDSLACQWHPNYRLALFNYRKALKTRNYLLKHRSQDLQQITAYSQQLALHGNTLRELRAALASLLTPHLTHAYQGIVDKQENVCIQYQPADTGDLFDLLCRHVQKDIRSGQTGHGPHRDDLLITLNGQAAAKFASEGQQRTIAIAMKLAQSSFLAEETGCPPIHLIDDVFGELDPARRIAFLATLPANAQCLITTTHLDWLQHSPCPLPILHLHGGTLHPEHR